MTDTPISAVAPDETAAHLADGLPMPRRAYATIAIMATLALVVLDGAIANVALPSIATSLNVAPAETVWVVTAYQLALVMGILPSAALGESLGHRRVYVAGVALFILASVASALAPGLSWLVLARFVQGLAAAPLMALGVAILRFTYPQRLIGGIIGWLSMVIALSSAFGPAVGAAILTVADWPWLFAVNVPIGLVVLTIARALPKPAGSGRPFDMLSVALNALAFGALVIGADKVFSAPLPGLALLALSGLGFVALVRREMPRPAPLIPIDLLRERSFRISIMASVSCFTGQMASYVALPFLFQHEFGMSVIATGLSMTPWPLMVAFAGPISGKLVDRGVSGGLLCAIGGALIALGLGLTALWPTVASPVPVILFTMVCGVGFGLFQVPNNRNMLLSAPKARSGAAGGAQGTARLIGQTFGGLIMGVLFSLPIASELALRVGLGLAALLTLIGGGISLLRAGAHPGAGAEPAR